METTQKTREETAQRRPHPKAESGGKPVQPSRKQPPQKTAAEAKARPAAKAASEQKKTAKPKPADEKKAPSGKAAPVKKTAPAKKAAPVKKKAATREVPDDLSNKKRAYGNSKPKKKSAISTAAASLKNTVQKTKRKKSSGASRPKEPTPAVIYTQPQAFNRRRFFVQLVTVVAIVAALVLGLSVFFKVETITVAGAEVYSAWAIREASGISEGDNLLTFSHARAGAQIKANLPYVKTVRFGIKLPDTVNIIIEEEDVVYAIKDTNSQWWLINSDGHVVEQSNSGKAANYTQILGVNLDTPVANQQGVAAESAPTETQPDGTPVPVTVTGAQRFSAALQILKALEENDVVGDAASVDVSRTEDIVLWYGTRYQVNLGDNTRLPYKIACMNDVILQMSDYQSGILDISFTNWPNQVGYTPFE